MIRPSCGIAQDQQRQDPAPKMAFIGLHGGVFETLKTFAEDQSLKLTYLRDGNIADGTASLDGVSVLFLQHTRDDLRRQYQELIKAARSDNPSLRVFSLSGLAEADLPELTKAGVVEKDEALSAYYGSSPENLRRLLIYARVKLLGQPGEILPPDAESQVFGLFHPESRDMFGGVEPFLEWARKKKLPTIDGPRVVIAVHGTHLTFQQPRVVEALVRECERNGALAVAMVDYGPDYERDVREFRPAVIIHTCHSRERVSFREELEVPHLHSIFMREQSINDWQVALQGLSSSEMAFHIVGQELLGAIEPQVTSGTPGGRGSEEAFTPIADRVEHLVSRAMRWVRLGTAPNRDKRIAFVYYDREMGQAELMRGSATGMFMNGPRSMVNVLQAMQQQGYGLDQVPESEDQLLAWMMEHGRQIGVWAPGVLERLARSGNAVLIPTEDYVEWFEKRVPADLRDDVIQRWGPPPGKFLVWKQNEKQYLVIPRVDLGNVILLPQPLRGEAQDTSLVHDLRVPPPHNYLATYFWLDEEFHADAMVHFGTHGSEFMLPGKPTGLSGHDWPDIVLGSIPNINPWVLNNLGESSPVKRRAYAVLIDHLVPPSVNAELSDQLSNLHDDIDKWVVLSDGALREKFREAITQQVRDTGLAVDCHLDLPDGQLVTPEQIDTVLTYLHDIHNETTPVSLHVFGKPPADELLLPYLVVCGGSDLLTQLGELIEVPASESLTPGDRKKYLRRAAEELVRLHLRKNFSLKDALDSVGARLPENTVSEQLEETFQKLTRLSDGFRQTPQEVEQLLAALNGRFIPPGPGNSPDRNPASLPTGRNMYVMNPEEVPTQPSWELGRQLVDQLLQERFEKTGRYPQKIAFTLNSFATFQDYGVMESQILYLLGCRPQWDEKNLVADVELIPLDELGRPRVDVFIAGLSYYRDMLPTRMRLIDRAVRLVAEAEEPEGQNPIRQNSLAVEQQLIASGVASELAAVQSRGRIFGYPEGQMGSAGYYYLVEKSGEWDTREQLMDVYLGQVRNVYTEGAWGTPAAEAYNRHIQGTEIVLRSWSDRTRSPLSNKYDWYHGGSLALAVEHLTGQKPEFLLSDVRDPDAARVVSAEDALRQDFRVRLFNRKWIEGMMREGYAGADQISVHVTNSLGWTIMRPGSVGDDYWTEIIDTFIRDKKNLQIKEWFESENPFAYQDLTETLLETIRKGYWQPDADTIREIAEEYARSVVQHGEGGGLRGGGNFKLEAFVQQTLAEPNDKDLNDLLTRLKQRAVDETLLAGGTLDSTAPTIAQTHPAMSTENSETNTETQEPDASPENTESPEVTGKVLEPVNQQPSLSASSDVPESPPREYPWSMIAVFACLLLIGAGYASRWGIAKS
ncbi:MAG: cobaltochelatase subunit CobN [Planctomycetaceae bacterium]|nr:cobaltochelatase subunit CobN [Planctomycetaceae bacterium]